MAILTKHIGWFIDKKWEKKYIKRPSNPRLLAGRLSRYPPLLAAFIWPGTKFRSKNVPKDLPNRSTWCVKNSWGLFGKKMFFSRPWVICISERSNWPEILNPWQKLRFQNALFSISFYFDHPLLSWRHYRCLKWKSETTASYHNISHLIPQCTHQAGKFGISKTIRAFFSQAVWDALCNLKIATMIMQ